MYYVLKKKKTSSRPQLELLQKEFELEQKILQAQAQKIQQERALTALRNTQNSERITADLGRELEDAQRLPSAFDFDNEVLDQRIRQTRRLEDITRQYTDAMRNSGQLSETLSMQTNEMLLCVKWRL